MKVWGGVRLHRPKYLSRLTLLWILSNGMHILGPNTLGQGTILSGKVRTQQHRVPTSSNMTPLTFQPPPPEEKLGLLQRALEKFNMVGKVLLTWV